MLVLAAAQVSALAACRDDLPDAEFDLDLDGFATPADCDDTLAAVHPGAPELCDGLDNDCDTAVDDSPQDATTWYADADQDSFGDPATGTTVCTAPDGTVPDGTDCDDHSSQVQPGAAERCNGFDDNCDTLVDDAASADATAWHSDADLDGFGDPEVLAIACDAPAGASADGTDCDDGDAAVHPGAAEACADGVDQDCDGVVDADCRDPVVASLGGAATIWVGEAAGDLAGSVLVLMRDVDGDGWDDAAVAAPLNDGAGTSAGRLYLFRGPVATGTVPLSDADAVWSGAPGDLAGLALAANGDLDGDGWPDLAVGAPYRVGDEPQAGVVAVLSGLEAFAGGDLAEAAHLLTGPLASGHAGTALAAGDVDGDGTDDLIVGAPDADSSRGVAWLVLGPLPPGQTSLSAAVTTWQGASPADRLGAALVVAGDLDGDAAAEVVLGVPGDDTAGGGAGAAWVARGPIPAGVLAGREGLLVLDGASAGDAAGAVLRSVDLDGDGWNDLAVGAPYASGRGQVYGVLGGKPLVAGSLGGADLVFTGAASGDGAGAALAAEGDLDSDGFVDLVIGSGVAAAGDGRVWVWFGPLAPGSYTAESAHITLEPSVLGDGAGWALATGGDLNGDARDDLLVGSPSPSGLLPGSVWRFSGLP